MGLASFNRMRRQQAQKETKLDLSNKSKRELKEIAEEKGLKNYKDLNKEELTEYIKTGVKPEKE